MLRKKAAKHFGSPPVSRQDRYGAARFQKLPGIFCGSLCIAGIRRQLFGRNTYNGARRYGVSSNCKCVCHVERKILQPFQKPIKGEEKAILRGGNKGTAAKLPDILREPLHIFPGTFRTSSGLVQKDKRILRDIVCSGCHRVDHGKIAVTVRHQNSAAQALGIRTHVRGKRCRIV